MIRDSRDTWTVRRILKGKTPDGDTVHATVGLNHLRGNARPYFSATAYVWYAGGRYVGRGEPDCCGQMHDAILAAFPELAPVVALHLSDDNGTPMHAVANGRYHYQERGADFCRSYLRITDERLESVRLLWDAATVKGEPQAAWEALCAALAQSWAEEAHDVRKLLENLPAE